MDKEKIKEILQKLKEVKEEIHKEKIKQEVEKCIDYLNLENLDYKKLMNVEEIFQTLSSEENINDYCRNEFENLLPEIWKIL